MYTYFTCSPENFWNLRSSCRLLETHWNGQSYHHHVILYHFYFFKIHQTDLFDSWEGRGECAKYSSGSSYNIVSVLSRSASVWLFPVVGGNNRSEKVKEMGIGYYLLTFFCILRIFYHITIRTSGLNWNLSTCLFFVPAATKKLRMEHLFQRIWVHIDQGPRSYFESGGGGGGGWLVTQSGGLKTIFSQ